MCITKETKYQCRRTFRDQLFQVLILEVRMCQHHSLFVTEAGQNPYILTYPCSLDLFRQSGLYCHSFRQYFRAHYWPSTVSSPKGNNKLMILFSTLQSKRGIGTSFQVTILDGNESVPLEIQTHKKYIVRTCLTCSYHVPID